jgi:methyl-accepting chemotaxis protein
MRVLKRFGLGTRIGGGFALSILSILAVVVPSLMLVITNLVDRAVEKEASDEFSILRTLIDTESSRAASLASMVARQPLVIEAMKTGDRDRLAQEFVPGFKSMVADYGVEQMQFHLPPATSFLRVHQPAKFGDDLSSFRHTVVEANTGRKPVVGLESGVAGLGIRAVVPVTADRHLGTVEFGMSLGAPLVQRFKRSQGSELSLFVVGKDGRMTAFASTLGGEIATSTADLEAALRGERLLRYVTVGGLPKVVLVTALPDYSGRPAAAAELVMDIASYRQALADGRLVGILAALFALGLGVAFTLVIHRTVARPVQTMTAVMEQLATGDLAVSIPEPAGRDEIAQMARALTVFRGNAEERSQLAEAQERQRQRRLTHQAELEKLARAFSKAIAEPFDAVMHSVREMAAAAESLASSADATRVRAVSMASASTQAIANVEAVSSAADALAGSIGEIAHQVDESNRITGGAVNQADTTSKRVGELTETASRIGAVLKLIHDIAGQTNLLALNATIEAARAGEAGKGFAVVASEVKNLATQTARATEEIAAQINAIQTQTTEAATAIGAITGTIRSINEVNGAIATAVERQGGSTRVIAGNAQQAVVGTRQVSEQVGTVADTASETSLFAGRVSGAADHVAVKVKDVQDHVSAFVSRVNALLSDDDTAAKGGISAGDLEKLVLGLTEFDRDHQKLLEIYQRLGNAMREGRGRQQLGATLDEMVSYAAAHFQREEAAMQKYGYPEFEAHRAEHRAFAAKAGEIQQLHRAGHASSLTLETLDFVRNWLFQHIQGSDQLYAPFFKARGMS